MIDLNGLKDLKTTIPGIMLLVVVIVISIAMLKGLCPFERWWELMLIILGSAGGLAGGLKLIFNDPDKKEGDKPK